MLKRNVCRQDFVGSESCELKEEEEKKILPSISYASFIRRKIQRGGNKRGWKVIFLSTFKILVCYVQSCVQLQRVRQMLMLHKTTGIQLW